MPESTEIFAEEGLSNIFNVALIAQFPTDPNPINHYRVIGCRLEISKPENVRILQGSVPDSNGVYAATVFYNSYRE